jgi:hypothetical protein
LRLVEGFGAIRALGIEALDAAPRLVGALPIGVRQVLLRVAEAAARTAAADLVLLVVEAARDNLGQVVVRDLAGGLCTLGDHAIAVEPPAGGAGSGRHGAPS